MRKSFKVGLLSVVAVLAMSAVAVAATITPGSSYNSQTGVLTLVNNGGAGSSYEDTSSIPIANGDTITFEYRSSDVNCGGGVPRVFVQGGAYNTFDGNPDACGTDADNDGWNTVSATISGVAAGPAGHTGIVNDNPSDTGSVQYRNVFIDGVRVLPLAPQNKDQCKNGGWQTGPYKNQGQCVSSFASGK